MSRIRLHPKHGVNPSLDLCFWCEQPKGLVLMGANRGKEAPRQCLSSYEPCADCASKMAQGITFVEVTEVIPGYPGPDSFPEIQKGLVPTGRWMVIRENAVKRFLQEPMLSDVLTRRKCFIDHETFTMLNPSKERDVP